MSTLTPEEAKPKSWLQRIYEADADGSFTDDDSFDAGSWIDCACGRLTPQIPRWRIHEYPEEDHADDPRFCEGAPIDDTLYDLGLIFSACVEVNDFEGARSNLDKIEVRAAEILKELIP